MRAFCSSKPLMYISKWVQSILWLWEAVGDGVGRRTIEFGVMCTSGLTTLPPSLLSSVWALSLPRSCLVASRQQRAHLCASLFLVFSSSLLSFGPVQSALPQVLLESSKQKVVRALQGCWFWCPLWRSRARMSWCVVVVVKTTHLMLVCPCAFANLQVRCGSGHQLLGGRRQDEREREHLRSARPDCIPLDTGLFTFVLSYI